jgi:hypothetical protein
LLDPSALRTGSASCDAVDVVTDVDAVGLHVGVFGDEVLIKETERVLRGVGWWRPVTLATGSMPAEPSIYTL